MKPWTMVLALFWVAPVLAGEMAARVADPTRLSALGKRIEQTGFPPLTWRIPRVGGEIHREVLPNGLVVYLYPDRSVPTAHVSLQFKGGSLYETVAEDQVASLLGSFIRLGGTRKQTYEEISEELESLSASVSPWIGSEAGQVGGRCLKENLPRILELIHDTLLEPGFREEKLGLVKKQAKEEILRQRDYPGWVLSTLFGWKLWGDHPYGRIARVPRIEAITRQEIENRHRKYAVPNRSYLAIAGDIEVPATLGWVRALFGGWPRAGEDLPPAQKVSGSFEAGFYHFEKDIPQANIRLGHLGSRRINPDELALEIMNRILGGEAFKSRLSARVRSDEGLAYSVGSWFSCDTLEPASFGCYAETRNEKAFRTIQIMKETIREMTEKPPTAEELKQAKDTVINSFIHRWTNATYAVGQIMQLEIEGYPLDYYGSYIDRVTAITAEEVLRVSRKYLHPDQLVIVLVGKRAEFKDLPGDVTLRELTLPPEYMQ
ncbi:MAG: insulinase family protein [Candidatus Riflebacteria bacterium]|nr:insulinase family protein [Candidatus Riflebacteria bacterium]